MLVSADWVAPVSHPPIRDGAVLIRGREIGDVGTLEALRERHPNAPIHAHPGCVIVPGLVNAHTHLSFTALAGLMPVTSFAPWLTHIAAFLRYLTHDDFATSASVGALDCLMTGATVVGDITIGPEDLSAAGDQGVGGVFFWEVHGLAPLEMRASLARREFPDTAETCGEGRLQCGIAPQAPYACGPGLIKASQELARSHNRPLMMHLAESTAEVRLLASGSGSLAPFAKGQARDFIPPGVGSVRYADALGVLENTVAVHCVHLASGEAELLAAKARGVVLCAGANRYMRHGAPPVAELRESGARMAIGTDSLANNVATDLFAEARLLRDIDPDLTAERLLEMLTLEGATVLGLDRLFGSLDAGKQADLAVVEIGPTSDPVAELIANGSPGRVQAVMSLGVWRILEGLPTTPVGKLRQEIDAITAKLAHTQDRTARIAERGAPHA